MVEKLGKLQKIGKDAYFGNSRITDLENLQEIGGSADFYESVVERLGKLQKIGKNADFEGTRITTLENLQEIGGFAVFANSQITDLGNLQNIKGKIKWGNKVELKKQYEEIQERKVREEKTRQEIRKIAQEQKIGEFLEFVDGVTEKVQEKVRDEQKRNSTKIF